MVNSITNNIFSTGMTNKVQRSPKTNAGIFTKSESELTCPYSNLAKDGVIEYKGVTFCCDYRHNAITLGDMSNPKKVLNIGLPSGGVLKVNVDNFGDLAKASGMFTPADLNAIMKAIQTYNHCTSKLNEIEDEENESPEEAAESEENTEANNDVSSEMLRSYNDKIFQKLMSDEELIEIKSNLKLDYEEKLSAEELERRIDRLFEDPDKEKNLLHR